ncbi:MAG: hypothetical protein ABFC56_07550 [Clostridiaceae bacterium]
MRKHRIWIIVSILTVVILATSGCVSTTSSESTAQEASASDTVQQIVSSDAVYVQVQSIDSGTVTAVVGTMTQPAEQTGGAGQQSSSSDQSQGTGSAPQGTPPAQPSGDNTQQGTPPQQLSGDTAQQSGQGMGMGFTAGDAVITFQVGDTTLVTKQNGPETAAATLDDIAVGDILAVTLSNQNVAESIVIQSTGAGQDASAQGGQPGANFGGSDTVTNGTAATTIDADTSISAQTYSSSGDDENALRIDNATVTLSGITVNKTGGASSNTENGDFYGMNAGLLALNGATVTITGATVTTNAVNGNGVFSYGSGTTVNISDSKIRTTMNNSGGIQTTGGATMNATNLDVETQGNSAAAIRSDRGGGDVNVTGGTYVTNGTGSPAIYSTADISADSATLTANASEAIVVEGKNSVTLNNVALSGNMQASTDANENVHNIMLYQSMSGDAEVGHSSFTATGGSILANAGDMFYVTNTTCTISLSNVALTLANDNLLTVSGNSSSRGWGTAGANGGTCTFTASKQTLSGIITVDSISSLDFQLADGSVFTGSINPAGAAGTVNVTLGSGCQWILTGDSYITSFTGDVSNIVTNGYTVYVNGTAITK